MGDGNGDTPDSEISGLVDSAPGEAAAFFQVKKDVILAPGVLGAGLWSFAAVGASSEPELTRSGGGLVVGFRGAWRGAWRDIVFVDADEDEVEVVVMVAERWCALGMGPLLLAAAPAAAETTGSLTRRGRKGWSCEAASARLLGKRS